MIDERFTFKTTGRVVYDPFRPGLKTKNSWWCVLEIDSGLVEYYRWWVNKVIANPIKLPKQDVCMPSWGAHMSIIRGEKPKPGYEHLWKKYHGQKFDIFYSHIPRKTTKGEEFWFIDCICPQAKAMRDEFAIPSDWNFHITIGRVWND